jgi:hypothetical protein
LVDACISPQADIAIQFCHVRFGPILLQKSAFAKRGACQAGRRPFSIGSSGFDASVQGRNGYAA